jgi:hypothetical protein
VDWPLHDAPLADPREKRMIRRGALSVAGSMMVLAGCSEDSVGIRFAGSESVAAAHPLASGVQSATPPRSTFQSSDGLTFTLNEARVNLRDIELDLPSGENCEDRQALIAAPAECKGSSTVILPGPFVVDLASGTSTPDLSTAGVPADTYKRIDFRFDEVKAGEGVPDTDPLYDTAFTPRPPSPTRTSRPSWCWSSSSMRTSGWSAATAWPWTAPTVSCSS